MFLIQDKLYDFLESRYIYIYIFSVKMDMVIWTKILMFWKKERRKKTMVSKGLSSITRFNLIRRKIIILIKPLLNKKGQKNLGYPTKKQSFSL